MSDLERLKKEYEDRERRFAGDDRYSTSNVSYRFMMLQLQNHIRNLMTRTGRTNLSLYRLLEIGCGNGNILMDFQSYNAQEKHLFGIDLLPARLHQAHASFPLFPLACSDGQDLPFQSQSFDLVMQFTALSSILDEDIRKNVADEMCRVVKQDGLILWYDFWLNPTNPQTHGIRPAEIRRLFPGCKFDFQRITLAPPIARRLVPVSWLLCAFLEKLRIFNTHYLVAITKIPPSGVH